MGHFIPYGRQSIDQNDVDAVAKSLQQPLITRGEETELFEERLAQRCQSRFAVTFNSGSSALQAAYFAADASRADRLVTSPVTFASTATAAMQRGVEPCFIDVDPSTGNIDLDLLELNINQPKTRGKEIITPVHLAGIAVDMRRLSSMVRSPSTYVIEDAAHALGSQYPTGEQVGSCAFSDMTIFSFHPLKNITCGEGGAVTCNSEQLYDKLKLFRNNGIWRDPATAQEKPWSYQVLNATGNYHLTDIQAALGSSQLKRLDLFLEKRRSLVRRYRELFADCPLIGLCNPSYDKQTGYHLFVIQVDWVNSPLSRSAAMQQLFEAGIGTQVHYIPLYYHPCIEKVVGDIAEYFPKTELYYQRALSLPLYPDLSFAEVEFIADKLKQLLQP